ncbi:UNVERIFIED_CONTAM: hypothetical protein GTU68_007625 [Idotea baltica]|nr:hypothetical protein [Idotea baltica]
MKIAVASDHRGFQVKQKIMSLLQGLDQTSVDYGPASEDSVDYPDYAAAVAHGIAKGDVDCGILVCGTGLGMSIAANKFHGIRAALCHDDLTARMSRLHNDANVLCLSADLLSEQLIDRMVEIWVTTEFEGGRHARRLDRIRELESEEGTADPKGCC